MKKKQNVEKATPITEPKPAPGGVVHGAVQNVNIGVVIQRKDGKTERWKETMPKKEHQKEV